MPRPRSKQATLPFDAPARPTRPAPAPGARQRGSATAPSGPKPELEPVTSLVLRKSPARLKLEAVEKEHERLLRAIDKKKVRCVATEHTVRDAHDAVHARAEPLRAALTALLRDIHQIFDRLLAPRSRLSRADRAALRRFHLEVIDGLPRPDVAEAAAPDDRDAEPRQSSRGGPTPFEGGWPGASNEVEHESASKPSGKNTGLLRALYRKLAVALHPDKARDPGETARLTSLMKEVTQAYANEDVAKLVELDRTWLAQTSADSDEDLERRAARFRAANGELRRQLRALTARLKDLELSLPGVSWPRRRVTASGTELAADLIASMEREVQSLESLRDAARDLFEGRINVPEFLMGPRPSSEDSRDSLDDIFEEMFEELLNDVRQGRRPRSGSRARRRG